MRNISTCVVLFLLVAVSISAWAELQNVTVGGSVRIRGNYIRNTFTTFQGGMPMPEQRWSPASVWKRPIGGRGFFSPVNNVMSIYDWDDRGDDVAFVEQRTRLHVRADFTQDVSAFIELDSYDVWGEDFRSDYVTGSDARARSVDDVEFFQAYIEADQIYGVPLRLRIGRQELAFGSQWLVGPRDFAFFYTGASFDALRLTYSHDQFTIDAWAGKLAENFADMFENDVDFYGVYGSYIALEGFTFDAYLLYLRDDIPIPNAPFGLAGYSDTNLFTVGLRGAMNKWNFDVDAEVAYQFGSADAIGATFTTLLAGDSRAHFDNWGAKLDVGYSFDYKCRPRLFAGFRYYGGEDRRDISFWDWLNPFHRPRASISFNRLFSNDIASGFMDLNNDASNMWWVRAGFNTFLYDKFLIIFFASHYEAVEPFRRPLSAKLWGNRVPLLPGASWITKENPRDLGYDIGLFTEYHYSEDLIFELGYTHHFVGPGQEYGTFSRWNGLAYNGGTGKDGGDYIYAGTRIKF